MDISVYMCLYHDSLNIYPKERRLVGTMNMYDVDLYDQWQDHQLLLVLNGPIWEEVVVVQVHVQWTQLEEGEKVEEDIYQT
jgi:hypothetical protein